MVFIIIAVQNGLDYFKESLKKKGYTVVDIENCDYPVDALLFEGNEFQISYFSRNNRMAGKDGERTKDGTLIINSRGKSIEQIDEMLSMKCYEHLF